MVSAELQALQKRLHHAFANPKLLERALTHRSFGADHNERLEFLGDAVLNLAVSGYYYAQYYDKSYKDYYVMMAKQDAEEAREEQPTGGRRG